MNKEKIAVVLFNLGGPDQPSSVKPFLFNLFRDPAIIGVPNPFRWMIAKLISTRRAPVAREIYAHLGGKSPLLEQTVKQAEALESSLGDTAEIKCFIAMRYWHPMSDETALNVKKWGADRVVLLPLYPQYSTTTTGSSTKDWHRASKTVGLSVPTLEICCYGEDHLVAEAHTGLINQAIARIDAGHFRILFSAHGLPKKIVEKGDPYQQQIEATVSTIVGKLTDALKSGSPDHVVCYQSRVGPLEWIGPSTEDEIERAGKDGKAIIMVPVAFVSEHSETLVELDIEYRELAKSHGVDVYERVPTLQCEPKFIQALADLVKRAIAGENMIGKFCQKNNRACPALKAASSKS